MKKIIFLSMAAIMLLMGQNVYAQDFFITDINAEYNLALTSDGYVFQAKSSTGSEKSLIKEGVAALTDTKNVYLMKDGSIDKNGEIITGLDVKYLIADNSFECYIDNSNRLHNSFDKDGNVILENVAEAKVLVFGGLYIKTNSGDLYFYGNGYNGDKKLQFLASDVCDYSAYYYLKNNGDLYYINLAKNMSSLIMHDVDIWQGISSMAGYAATVYQNGMFKILEYGNCVSEYGAPHGVNDMTAWGYDILYIGKDKLLYFLDIHSYYGNFKKGEEREFCLSDTILFDRLCSQTMALDVNNNLYNVVQETYKTSFGNNYNGIYENLNVYFGNPVAGAIPSKIDYYNTNVLVAAQNGACYTQVYNSAGNFLYNTFNSKNINLQVNGNPVKLSSPIQVTNDRTMYPLRDCFTAMGASVQWDGEKQIAAGEIPGIKIEFPIGKNEYYINGVRHEMDTAAYVDESIGRTYIPVRYAAEGLGFTVEWITGNLENTIDIHK